jgi:hypothetical protein
MSVAILVASPRALQYIVSTASRVLTATEIKYSTCEKELLAIVYALNKF